ncbi:MAG: hypothetical protein GY795_24585 [Desulfobacterales bacterium]|nr:hypothetical protein [Desulfobacterales bacterium]
MTPDSLPGMAGAPNTPARRDAWRKPVGSRLAALQGRRSWDLYTDVYAPAWDEMMAAGGTPGDAVALVCSFVETARGKPLDEMERGLVAKLVRLYGKAALYGMREAMGRTNDETARDWYRYGSQVARRTVAEIRRGEDPT